MAKAKKNGRVKQPQRPFKSQELAERRKRAWQMLGEGASFDMIVEAGIGYSTRGMLSQDLKRWRNQTVQSGAEEFVTKQLAVAESLLAKFAGPIGTSHKDRALDVQRGNLVLKILERIANMLGTDAPKKLQAAVVQMQITREEAREMSIEEIRHTLDTGQLPPRIALRLVQGEKRDDAEDDRHDDEATAGAGASAATPR